MKLHEFETTGEVGSLWLGRWAVPGGWLYTQTCRACGSIPGGVTTTYVFDFYAEHVKKQREEEEAKRKKRKPSPDAEESILDLLDAQTGEGADAGIAPLKPYTAPVASGPHKLKSAQTEEG